MIGSMKPSGLGKNSKETERFEGNKSVSSMNRSGGECADEGHQEFRFCLYPSPCLFPWRSP